MDDYQQISCGSKFKKKKSERNLLAIKVKVGGRNVGGIQGFGFPHRAHNRLNVIAIEASGAVWCIISLNSHTAPRDNVPSLP